MRKLKDEKDDEMHADEDKKKRDLIDAKNVAEQITYTAEKSLKDAEEKLEKILKQE